MFYLAQECGFVISVSKVFKLFQSFLKAISKSIDCSRALPVYRKVHLLYSGAAFYSPFLSQENLSGVSGARSLVVF